MIETKTLFLCDFCQRNVGQASLVELVIEGHPPDGVTFKMRRVKAPVEAGVIDDARHICADCRGNLQGVLTYGVVMPPE